MSLSHCFFRNETVDTVERDAAVIADDAAAAVGVRQAGDEAAVARGARLLVINAEHAVVVRGTVEELVLNLLRARTRMRGRRRASCAGRRTGSRRA